MIATVKKALSAVALAGLATLGVQDSTQASEGLPGLSMKAASAADAGCFSRNPGNYASIQNNCATAREIQGFVQLPSGGTYNTRISIFGNNSWCQTVTINGVGNGAQVGPATWTTAGPQSWQTLNLGARFIWTDMSISFRCVREPTGIIGNFNAG